MATDTLLEGLLEFRQLVDTLQFKRKWFGGVDEAQVLGILQQVAAAYGRDVQLLDRQIQAQQLQTRETLSRLMTLEQNTMETEARLTDLRRLLTESRAQGQPNVSSPTDTQRLCDLEE